VLVNLSSSISHIQFTALPINTRVSPFTKFSPVILITDPPASEPLAGYESSSSVTLLTGMIYFSLLFVPITSDDP
jgi:hypothetical protein